MDLTQEAREVRDLLYAEYDAEVAAAANGQEPTPEGSQETPDTPAAQVPDAQATDGQDTAPEATVQQPALMPMQASHLSDDEFDRLPSPALDADQEPASVDLNPTSHLDNPWYHNYWQPRYYSGTDHLTQGVDAKDIPEPPKYHLEVNGPGSAIIWPRYHAAQETGVVWPGDENYPAWAKTKQKRGTPSKPGLASTTGLSKRRPVKLAIDPRLYETGWYTGEVEEYVIGEEQCAIEEEHPEEPEPTPSDTTLEEAPSQQAQERISADEWYDVPESPSPPADQIVCGLHTRGFSAVSSPPAGPVPDSDRESTTTPSDELPAPKNAPRKRRSGPWDYMPPTPVHFPMERITPDIGELAEPPYDELERSPMTSTGEDPAPEDNSRITSRGPWDYLPPAPVHFPMQRLTSDIGKFTSPSYDGAPGHSPTAPACEDPVPEGNSRITRSGQWDDLPPASVHSPMELISYIEQPASLTYYKPRGRSPTAPSGEDPVPEDNTTTTGSKKRKSDSNAPDGEGSGPEEKPTKRRRGRPKKKDGAQRWEGLTRELRIRARMPVTAPNVGGSGSGPPARPVWRPGGGPGVFSRPLGPGGGASISGKPSGSRGKPPGRV